MHDFFSMKWWKIGWQGITLSVPSDWNIGAIGGERNQGYLRLDGPDMSRVEIKWAESGKGFVDIPGLVKKYLREMDKNKKQSVTVDREAIFLEKKRLRTKKSLECFSWHGETQGYGAAWFCPDCSRTVIIQVMGAVDEPVARLAERVILSLNDHPPDKDWIYWSTYGFCCETPADFILTSQKLMAGLIELEVTRGDEKLTVARWGMANVALRNATLTEWGKTELAKRLKKYATEYTEQSEDEYGTIHIQGKTQLPQEKLMSFFQHCLGKPYADRVEAQVWHCEKSNKIFYVEGILDRENLSIVQDVRDRMMQYDQSGEGTSDDRGEAKK